MDQPVIGTPAPDVKLWTMEWWMGKLFEWAQDHGKSPFSSEHALTYMARYVEALKAENAAMEAACRAHWTVDFHFGTGCNFCHAPAEPIFTAGDVELTYVCTRCLMIHKETSA